MPTPTVDLVHCVEGYADLCGDGDSPGRCSVARGTIRAGRDETVESRAGPGRGRQVRWQGGNVASRVNTLYTVYVDTNQR